MNTDFYEIKTAATELPVTLEEAKDWCRITHTSEDVLIDSLIQAATTSLEAITV